MSSEPNLVAATVTIAFGALAGGLTNMVAIWMLFHPYEAKGPGPWKLQGAIPKNKPRLAKTIGRTVGERLLTAEDLARQLSAPELREAFDEAVRGFVVALLETERGTLREELPPALLTEIKQAFESIAPDLTSKLADHTKTEDFRNAVAKMRERIVSEVGGTELSSFLTVARKESIRNKVEGIIHEAVDSDDLEKAIGHWLERQVGALATDETPLLERLPPALIAAVEKEIAGYLPLAMDRIASALSDPVARRNIQQSLHRLFEGFVKNLLLHERLVAKLVVTERTIARMLDNVERDGVDQVAKLLDEPAMRSQIARSVNDAVVKFLRQPMAEHLRSLGPERVDGLKATAQGHIIAALRDTATQSFVVERVDDALDSLDDWTWSDILQRVPASDIADLAAEIATSNRVQEWLVAGSVSAIDTLLDTRIGKPSERLPEGSIDRVSTALSPAIWEWIQQQIPMVVAKVDIQEMVEEKVLGFSLERIEEIVRRTTQRELDTIIKLGYVLGAFVGAVAYSISLLLT